MGTVPAADQQLVTSLPAGSEGIVRIASEFAVDRCIDDPAESKKVFRNGWFYPGDLGSLTRDNLLIVSGRQNDVLNAGGGKIAAEKVEAVLTSFKGVNQAAVFMQTGALGAEEVWAAIVAKKAIDAESLRAHCRTRIPDVCFTQAVSGRYQNLVLKLSTGAAQLAPLSDELGNPNRSVR